LLRPLGLFTYLGPLDSLVNDLASFGRDSTRMTSERRDRVGLLQGTLDLIVLRAGLVDRLLLDEG
jgi:hypothetical protein